MAKTEKVPTPAPTKKYALKNENPTPPPASKQDARVVADRNVGPGSSLHQRVIAENGLAQFMFGGPAMGPKDNGTHGMGPLPGSAAVRKNGEVVQYQGAVGRIDNDPAFKGAEPNEIKLAQMQDNREKETISDHRDSGAPAKAWVGGGSTKMVDAGMRMDTPLRYQNAPVRTWVDESIKLKKD
jgi:hypothetical protein